MTVFALFSRMHLASEGMHHVLQAIANAENRNSQIEYALIGDGSVFVVHRRRAPRKNDAHGRVTVNLRERGVTREDYGENILFADAARNQLRILSAKVEDNDGLVFH